MKPMMQSRYVGWMAVRHLRFGDEHYEPGDRVPQRHLETMRDPEVLVRTNRLAAVAKDMNKVPRYLRKDVTHEDEMRSKILRHNISTQNGPVMADALLPSDEDITPPGDLPEALVDGAVEDDGELVGTDEPNTEEAGADRPAEVTSPTQVEEGGSDEVLVADPESAGDVPAPTSDAPVEQEQPQEASDAPEVEGGLLSEPVSDDYSEEDQGVTESSAGEGSDVPEQAPVNEPEEQSGE